MQPAPLRTSSPFTRPTHMRRTPPMGNMQQQAFARVLLKCFKGVIIGQSGHWAACVPRASIPQMFATSRSHLTADPKLTDGHQVVQTDARHAGRVSMTYVRRGTTKHVMNVRSGPPPTPKPNKMHRNVDTSVRCTEIADIGLRSARARPGGGAGHPGEYFRGRRAPPRAPPARASAGGAACQLRTPRGVANSREPEARPRHVHCACCHGCSCPQGPPGGHRTPEPAPQCTLLTRTSTPAARASCPAHGHYGTAPGAAASQQGRQWAVRGTR